MYSRDPFNLRKAPPTALLFLQNAAATTIATSTQAIETTKQAIQDADMSSFAVPRHVPNFENAQRRLEDNVWSKFSGNDKGLPMYKDKPAGYGARRGARGWLKRKRTFALGGLVVLSCLYWLGWIGGGGSIDGSDKASPAKGGWSNLVPGTKKGDKADWDKRREAVKDAFLLSWRDYEAHGWGKDEYHPVSKSGRFMAEPGGLGWIIVDALDTMMLMNLTTELKHARQWVSQTLDYDKQQDVNTFETTIRMVGGLLSAHYLQDVLPGMKPEKDSEQDIWLEKATDLADKLMGAYESPSGVPWASVILRTGKGEASHADGGASSTAEATTLQLEMKYLAYLTGEAHYWEKAEKVMQVVDNNGAKDGLVPIFIYADRGTFRGEEIRLGSRGDSYYEYLIKQYYQTQKQEPIYLEMWDEALAGVKKHLITYSKDSDFTVLAERPNGLSGNLHPKMDHLVCFMPGTIALAATGGISITEAKKLPSWGKKQEEDMELARELMKTCIGMYRVNPTGLAPEIAHFNLYDPPKMMADKVLSSKGNLELDEGASWKADYIIKAADAHNLQRPETVESLFYMWRITGDEIYRQWGWEMFESFVKHTSVKDNGGFTSVNDVRVIPPPSRDNMESFWLAETLKYFYLLFGPNDVLPLDQIVLNTEAHPFPRFDASKKRFKTGWKRIPRDSKGNLIKEKAEVKSEKNEVGEDVVKKTVTKVVTQVQEPHPHR
ncbi:glycoside hydrolase family 47 protein [Pleomassaria siparia CBS 279.74]|uniref:alpha-1,2-Mannosidase n=1 Tax=Pleomassaria siparia CBS 279.74 TaxID=1314801 RepID=A0A6G1K6Q5_9PLEO|nr:glycoside hydrolase family 47 protein [Pleomassaria siparia CBS 279.74]